MLQVRAMAFVSAVSVATLVSPQSARADAVQWSAPGSNGHWYQGVALPNNTTWAQARERAAERGGHLATLTTQAEFTWVTQNFGGSTGLWHQTWGPFIGGIQDLPGAVEPLGGWRWITDEAWFDAWGTNNCGADNYNDGDALSLGRCSSDSDISYNDAGINATGNAGGVGHAAMIVEWSADCDGNGVVDFGEIRAGTLPDDNQNGVPDGCECAANPSLPTCCPGDVVATGFVDGVDLAALFSAWGTNGGEFPRADVDRSGVVDAADLYFVLANWGSCQG